MPDIFLRRIWVLAQIVGGSYHHARDAETALHCPVDRKCLLHRMQLGVGFDPFNRRHLLAPRLGGEQDTAVDRQTTDDNGARTAFS